MSKYDDWTNFELADAMVDSIEEFDGRDPVQISIAWDRSDMIKELKWEHGILDD